jgi:CPA2 family monovalent cation:H+ antiporter-2
MLYQLLLSTSFLSLLITPLLFAFIPAVLKLCARFALFGAPPRSWEKIGTSLASLSGHVILCGFGPTGRDLANAFKTEEIPFVIIEMNPIKVADARKAKLKVIYGDAANREVMRRAGILKAKAVVVSFPDVLGIKQIIRVVQDLNPDVMLAVRTRYEAQMPKLYDLGADVVVMEEWEASHELNRVVLEQLRVPTERIESHLARIRARKEIAIEEAIFGRLKTPMPGK